MCSSIHGSYVQIEKSFVGSAFVLNLLDIFYLSAALDAATSENPNANTHFLVTVLVCPFVRVSAYRFIQSCCCCKYWRQQAIILRCGTHSYICIKKYYYWISWLWEKCNIYSVNIAKVNTVNVSRFSVARQCDVIGRPVENSHSNLVTRGFTTQMTWTTEDRVCWSYKDTEFCLWFQSSRSVFMFIVYKLWLCVRGSALWWKTHPTYMHVERICVHLLLKSLLYHI